MTHTETRGRERLSRRRTYRRLLVGFVVAGAGLGITLRELLGYPLVGEAVYWVGIVGALAILLGTDVSLFDERDVALERRASRITLNVFAVVLVLGASAARTLSYTGLYDVPAEIWTVLWGYVALIVVFGLVYLGLRYRG